MKDTTLSTQLRIGNWIEVFTVKNRWEQLQIRSGLDIEEVMKAEEDPDDDRFRPIELDEKWLVKFGLEKIGDNFELNDFWLIWNVKDDEYDFISNSKGRGVKSIHQLQNLYHSLSVEELELKQS